MKLNEFLITNILAAFDRFMDWLTRGTWTKIHESEIPNIVKVNKE